MYNVEKILLILGEITIQMVCAKNYQVITVA